MVYVKTGVSTIPCPARCCPLVAPAAVSTYRPPTAGPLGPDQTYPDGAGPDNLDVSALAGNTILTHTPCPV